MGYMVANRVELSLFIGDIEYPLDLGSNNVLNYWHMAASTKFRLPTCCFSLLDASHALDKINLQDAIPIRLALRGNQGDLVTYNFRRFNSNRVLTGDAWQYTVDGYWDSSRFWGGTAIASVNGTSNGALSTIAQQCGLGFSGTDTADQMLWMPGNRKMHDFASMIQDAGYVDDSSLMKWGVDLDGTLRYRNINNLPDKDRPTKLLAYEQSQDSYTVVDYAPTVDSGFNNASTGYMNDQYIQSALAGSYSSVESQITVTSDSRSPEYNKTAREQTVRGKVSHSPINFGTVHPKMERARYQNNRYSGLFSVGMEFLINTPTKVKLFDTINFTTQTEQQKEDRMFSGIYVVTGRVVYVKGATYAEKLYATRQGTNLDYVSK